LELSKGWEKIVNYPALSPVANATGFSKKALKKNLEARMMNLNQDVLRVRLSFSMNVEIEIKPYYVMPDFSFFL
jgi:hypothetical protein